MNKEDLTSITIESLTGEGSAYHAMASLGVNREVVLMELTQITQAMSATVPDGHFYFSQIPMVELNLAKANNEGADIISRIYGANFVLDFYRVVVGLEETLDNFKPPVGQAGSPLADSGLAAWTETIVARNYTFNLLPAEASALHDIFAGRGVMLEGPAGETEIGDVRETVHHLILSRLAANLFRAHQAGALTVDQLKAMTLPKVFENANIPAGYKLV